MPASARSDPNDASNARRVVEITGHLRPVYPDRRPLLAFESPYQLMIAVILSAQTTDAQVNTVTRELFRRYPTPASLAAATQAEIERIVHSTGFFRNKAKNIIGAAVAIQHRFLGQVPESMDALVSIPGMGRKSANVIRGAVFGKPAIAVDTHLTRVSNRLGLVNGKNPVTIERALRALVPEALQTEFSMAINLHGRYRCFARAPDCTRCEIRRLCPYPGIQ
jgi:endonuclease-3